MARRKLELEVMVMELIILLVLAVVGRCMRLFGTHGGGANSRWWGDLLFQLVQERTAKNATGEAEIACIDSHRDTTACDYFVKKKTEHKT